MLAGLSVVGVSGLAGCPSGDEDTETPSATLAATPTQTPPTETPTPPTETPTPPTETPTSPTDQLHIPAGETHTIGANVVESYLSVEWGTGAGLVIEPGGALELTTDASG
jgi:hypothetical protein